MCLDLSVRLSNLGEQAKTPKDFLELVARPCTHLASYLA